MKMGRMDLPRGFLSYVHMSQIRPRHSRAPALPEDLWQARLLRPQDISAATLPSRAAFDAFAAREDVPGALGLREVKFVIEDVHTDAPKLHLINAAVFPLHYYFVRDHLGMSLGIAAFNRVTYFTDSRHYIVGSILAYDSYLRADGTPGLYSIEFWPTDPIHVEYVALSYHLLRAAMPFAADLQAYHPSGDVQEQRFARQADAYAARHIPTISSAEIFESIEYSPLNLGEAVGTLRLITGREARPPSPTDIVIYDTLPNDLPLVAGVLTTAPQTPLSHVNLRARQNNIPNAYLRSASSAPGIIALLGQSVRMIVRSDTVEITPASHAEQEAAMAARRPDAVQIPLWDRSARYIVALDDLHWGDVEGYGAKATNLAELRRTIDPAFVPNGYAVPFAFYDEFMTANGLYQVLADLRAQPEFGDDTQRAKLLKKFRKTIKAAPVPTLLRDQLDGMHRAFPAGTTPRCRSSANSEDLVGFTGAGLYDSYTHRLDEGHIEKSIKQVWASLWTFRAYQEREFYRVDHSAAVMGVLVHPNYDDERVNGVALTRNIYFPQFEGYYVNAQIGEDMVTNPSGDETAEEIVILKDLNEDNTRIYEMIYVRRSSLVGAGETVIGQDDLMLLVAQMKRIHSHFRGLYLRQGDEAFAMDIEFKIDRDGALVIKQVRPWAG